MISGKLRKVLTRLDQLGRTSASIDPQLIAKESRFCPIGTELRHVGRNDVPSQPPIPRLCFSKLVV